MSVCYYKHRHSVGWMVHRGSHQEKRNAHNSTVYHRVLYIHHLIFAHAKQRCTRGYKRYKETSGLIEWKDCQIFHSIFT